MGKCGFTRAARIALLCSAACGMAAPAYAQEPTAAPGDQTAAPPPEQEVGQPTPQDPPAQPSAQQGGLEEIIVTARKRAENLQNIPVAETVISKREIENLRIDSIERVASLAPQLVVGRNGSGNGASIGLRGVSVAATSISLEQSVAIVVDGVYYSGGRALNMGMFDLQQVEVLKGPQSLFYGKNTTAGAISFTTADPTSTFQAMNRIGYEFRGKNPYAEAFVSGPITNQLSFRVAGRFSKQFDPLIRNVSEATTTYTRDIATGITTQHEYPDARNRGERNAVVRGGLKFDNDAGLTATLKATYNKYDSATPNSSSVIGRCEELGVVQTDPTAPCGEVFRHVQGAIPSDIAATLPFKAGNGRPFLDYKAFNTTLNLQYEAGPVTFSLTPAYINWRNYWNGDFDFTDNYLSRSPTVGGSSGNNANTYERQKAFSVEARAQSHLDGPVNFMAGGYYQDSDLIFQQANIFPGGIENSAAPEERYRYLTVFKDSHTFGKTYAVFGQVLWDITPQLNLTAGVRHTRETKDQLLSQPYVFPGSLGSFAVRAFETDQKFRNTSPEATITYKPTRDITTYLSYKTGYKSGGLSISGTISPATTLEDADFGPEKARGFEGGIKSTLLDNQLRLNFDFFRYKYTGLQIDYFDPLTIRYLTLNAATSRTQGAEIEAQFSPHSIRGLTVRGGFGYTDAKYTDFPIAPCIGGQRPDEGCNLNQNPVSLAFTAQDLTGDRMPQAPKYTATGSVDYATPIMSAMELGFSVAGRYSSRYKFYAFAPDNADRFFQPSYFTVDASVRLSNSTSGWELALIGRNLTNKFIVSTGFDLTYTGARAGLPTGIHADTRTSIYDPRTIAVQGTYRF
jgi:iron complex outermembrane recepter protein